MIFDQFKDAKIVPSYCKKLSKIRTTIGKHHPSADKNYIILISLIIPKFL